MKTATSVALVGIFVLSKSLSVDRMFFRVNVHKPSLYLIHENLVLSTEPRR